MCRIIRHARRCLAVVLVLGVAGLPSLIEPRTALAQVQGAGATRNSAFFRQAQKELPGSYYFLYRVVDRLARANDLDKGPWRVVRMPEYDINAYATQVNLIAVYTGLLDVLAGDSDAMACVIGHEMAHHVKRHIPLKNKDMAQAKQRLEAKKNDILAKEEKRQASARGWSLLGGIVGAATGVSIPITPVPQADPEQMQQELLGAAKVEDQNLVLTSQRHEFEADKEGLYYMVRAGFDPKGCLRVMEALGRTPGAEFDSDHPAIPRRTAELEAMVQDPATSKLAAEGRALLLGSSALTYSLSADGESLRINSRFGSSKAGFQMNDL